MARANAAKKSETARVDVILSDPPETKRILADAIVKVSEAAEALRGAGLSDRALVLLIHDAGGVAKREIERVLDALPQLKTKYVRDWARGKK